MPKITALILTRFRGGAEKVGSWLTRESYEALFLDLPRDLEQFMKAHIDGEASIEDLWRSYGYLTGFQNPFINALKYTVDPILDALVQLQRIPKHEIYCYQDLEHHIEAKKLSERLLMLETTSKVSSRIAVEDWRTLLRDELECTDAGLRKTIEIIAEGAMSHTRNVILYRGMIKPFKDCMEAEGFTVETVYLQHYWRSPLDVLRVIAWAQGVESISDDVITRCVQHHLSYLDLILSSKNIDTAHEQWTLEIRRSILNNYGSK